MKRIYLGLCLLLLAGPAMGGEGHVYATWDTLELDTCASVWLIKRSVDPQAEFKFYPKGELIKEKNVFDTPDGRWRRTARASTFENILSDAKINDPVLKKIGAMIHTIEVNYWADMADQRTKELNQRVSDLVKGQEDPWAMVQKTFVLFDDLYAQLSRE